MRFVGSVQAGHTDKVWQCAWHPSGSFLASCSSDKTIRISSTRMTKTSDMEGQTSVNVTDTSNVAVLHDMNTDEDAKTVRSVSFSPDGIFLASAGFDGRTLIWKQDSNAWSQVACLEGHESEVKCVTWAPWRDDTGEYFLATCGRDKSIWIWSIDEEGLSECLAVLQEHSQDVKNVKFHPRQRMMASGSADDSIRIWMEDAEDGDWFCSQVLSCHTDIVWQVDFSSCGTLLASSCQDGSVRVWKKKTKGFLLVKELKLSSRPLYSLSFNASGNVVAVASGDNSIYIVDINGKDEDINLEHEDEEHPEVVLSDTIKGAHQGDVNHVIWYDDTLLASCSDDHTINIYTADNRT